MKAKDIEDVMQLWLYTNLKAHAFIPEYYWYENFNEVKSALSEAEIYVADQNKKVIGFIGLIDNYIAGIFVSEHMQLHGIGKQLLSIAKKRHPVLQLHVYKKNLKAIGFYQKQDFRIIKSTRIPEKKNFSWNGKIGRFEIKSPDGFYDKNINSQTKKFSKSQVAFLYHFSKNHTHSIFISI